MWWGMPVSHPTHSFRRPSSKKFFFLRFERGRKRSKTSGYVTMLTHSRSTCSLHRPHRLPPRPHLSGGHDGLHEAAAAVAAGVGVCIDFLGGVGGRGGGAVYDGFAGAKV